jgi:hypothetical protein
MCLFFEVVIPTIKITTPGQIRHQHLYKAGQSKPLSQSFQISFIAATCSVGLALPCVFG